eukprot:3865994-Pyramimonas_sp.AAC.1
MKGSEIEGTIRFARPIRCASLYDLLIDMHSALDGGALSKIHVSYWNISWNLNTTGCAALNHTDAILELPGDCLCADFGVHLASAAAKKKAKEAKGGAKAKAKAAGKKIAESAAAAAAVLDGADAAAIAGPEGDDDAATPDLKALPADSVVDDMTDDINLLQKSLTEEGKNKAMAFAKEELEKDPSKTLDEHFYYALLDVAFGREVTGQIDVPGDDIRDPSRALS